MNCQASKVAGTAAPFALCSLQVVYLQSECIEKYHFELCLKYDDGFDVIFG